MSQRKGWVFSLFSIFIVTFVIMVVLIVFTFFMKATTTQVTHTVKVVMEISDSGRKLMVVLNSQNSTAGISNIELLGYSFAANFDGDLYKYIIQSVEQVNEDYFGIVGIGEKTIVGTESKNVFSTEIPVPGAGKSGEIKTMVGLG